MYEGIALACERFGTGPLGQPANTVTSLGFVLAGAAILAARWRYRRGPVVTGVVTYAVLVAAVGVGSVVQHGPHPTWQAYAHDLPLASLLGFVAADALADLTSDRRRAAWWLVIPFAMVPLVALGPLASAAAQVLLAAAAIGLNLLRARLRPRLRRRLLAALAVLATGALIGTLTERTWLCQPETLLQGHAAWHLLAASALWLLAPAVGSGAGVRQRPPVAAEPEPS